MLAWLPGALGRRGLSLGVDDFGQSGTNADLYAHFGIDEDSVASACLSLAVASKGDAPIGSKHMPDTKL
jgi:pyruvate dehydrogenase E1 component